MPVMSTPDPLLAPIPGADHREIGGVQLDIARAGNARVKRVVYQPGFRWSRQMKPLVGTDLCQHAHVGFSPAARSTSSTPTAASWNSKPRKPSRLSRDTTDGWSATSPPC